MRHLQHAPITSVRNYSLERYADYTFYAGQTLVNKHQTLLQMYETCHVDTEKEKKNENAESRITPGI